MRMRPVVRRRIGIGVALLGVLFAAGFALDRYGFRLVYHRQIVIKDQFAIAVSKADEVVVRSGGFCHSTELDPVLFRISDAREVRDLLQHLAFEEVAIENSFETACMCCGTPSIDWYRKGTRIVKTSMQHGRRIRWDGFSTGRILGVRIGYGDAPLQEAAAKWLGDWLTRHSGQDFVLKPAKPGRLVVYESKGN